MPSVTRILRRNISSITTLLIGVFVFASIPGQIAVFDSGDMNPVTARTLPYMITSAIIVISLIMIVSDVVETFRSGADHSATEQKETTRYWRVFLAAAAIALWIILLPYLGFNITTILLVASIMIIIGNCRWWQIALLSLILSVPINYLLGIVLRVYLPSGSLFG